jgi:O-acetyl-ADP-ribose deacetylase (regulator of RNase III)
VSFKIGLATVEVKVGDLTRTDIDAVVNSANTHLWMGGGLASALKKAIRLGPLEIGTAVMTGGGALPAKHVIHAVVMGQDLRTDESKVRLALRAALRLAEEKAVPSVGLPALGTGVGGVSLPASAHAMAEVAIEVLLEAKHIRRLLFVMVDEEGRRVFHDEFLRRFSRK